jgi:nicotinate-nucleotide adenylyltransferase
VLAREAAFQLGLGRVVLIPMGIAPHREIHPEPGAEVRLEMARLATEGDELFEVSDVEVVADGPSYTFHTLERLSKEMPGEELVLLMGSERAASLDEWQEPRRVVELARLGVAVRSGSPLDEVEATLERLGAKGRYDTIRMPELGISSTRIRHRVASGRPVRHLVPVPVERFIAERGLYA